MPAVPRPRAAWPSRRPHRHPRGPASPSPAPPNRPAITPDAHAALSLRQSRERGGLQRQRPQHRRGIGAGEPRHAGPADHDRQDAADDGGIHGGGERPEPRMLTLSRSAIAPRCARRTSADSAPQIPARAVWPSMSPAAMTTATVSGHWIHAGARDCASPASGAFAQRGSAPAGISAARQQRETAGEQQRRRARDGHRAPEAGDPRRCQLVSDARDTVGHADDRYGAPQGRQRRDAIQPAPASRASFRSRRSRHAGIDARTGRPNGPDDRGRRRPDDSTAQDADGHPHVAGAFARRQQVTAPRAQPQPAEQNQGAIRVGRSVAVAFRSNRV